MPAHELSFLMILGIGMTLSGILITAISSWAIIRHGIRSTREITEGTREISREVREVAQMQREVAFMIRRQYGDIDRDLQEIKELLGGQ